MFFSISTTKKENFSCHFEYANWVINTDNGWISTRINNKLIVYKGYADYADINNILESIVESETPNTTGNFCCIVISNDAIQIKTDLYRSFPIYYDDSEITNLSQLKNNVYSSELVHIKLNEVTKQKFKIIDDLTEDTLSEDIILDKLHNFLNKKIESFVKHNTLPLKIFLSGGVDSMLVYSYMIKFANVEILKGEFFQFDEFYLKNHKTLKNSWAYNEISHFLEPNIFVSGAPGDEYMLRGPYTANLYCLVNGENIANLLTQEQYNDSYHKLYFNSDKNIKIFNEPVSKLVKNNKIFCYNFICNNLLNDYQHHHLGNTLTYTPLRDLEITKLLFQLPLEIALKQVMDGYISKKLIERNNSQLLNHISKFKNWDNHMANLIGLTI